MSKKATSSVTYTNKELERFITSPPQPKDVKFYIEEDAWRRIRAFAQVADHLEIGGFGFVRKEGKALVVYDVMLPNQEVSEGGIDLSPIDALDYAQEKDYPPEDLRFSWHTHGRGTSFWSTVDNTWIHEIGEQGTPWLLSMVTNADASMNRFRLDFFEPVRIALEDIKCVELLSDKSIEEAIAEAEEKVQRRAHKIKVTYIGEDDREDNTDDVPILPEGFEWGEAEVLDEATAARILADVGLSTDDHVVIEQEEDALHIADQDDEDEEAIKHDAAAQKVDRIRAQGGYSDVKGDIELEFEKGADEEDGDSN